MVQLAFVTMGAGAGPVTPAMLSQAWARIWPQEDPLEVTEGEDGSCAFPFMGGTGMVGYMPGPLPWSDLEGPAQCAWHWTDAVSVLKAHESHLLVGVTGENSPPKLQAIQLTLLTAAVCEAATAATAVYWASGCSVSPADRFVQLAQEMTPDSLPLLAWVEFRVFPNDDGSGWSIFTTGLKALGLMEIEVRSAAGNPSELVEKVIDIAGYLAQAGPVLKDGDTVGSSAQETLRIHHAPSEWDREDTVLWIEM